MEKKVLANFGPTMSQPQWSSDIIYSPTIFPKPDPNFSSRGTLTRVFCEIKDTSIFSNLGFVYKIKLRAALAKEGYYCWPQLWAYVDGNTLDPVLGKKWLRECSRWGFGDNLVDEAKGDEVLDLMFIDILYFALNCRNHSCAVNMVVISDNLEKDSIYARILEDSKSYNLNVVVARTGVLHSD